MASSSGQDGCKDGGKITIPSLVGVVPLTDIVEPRDVDVLCGRSGSSQRHVGTQQFRTLVNLNKGLYVTCMKSEKVRISRSIVAAIREQQGRFLERDGEDGNWFDIGDKKAIEKTSQALRENQPKLRRKIMEVGLPESAMPSSSSPSLSSSTVAQIPVNRSTQAIRSQQAMVERSISMTTARNTTTTATPPTPTTATTTNMAVSGPSVLPSPHNNAAINRHSTKPSSSPNHSFMQQSQQQQEYQMMIHQQQMIEQQQQQLLMERALSYHNNVLGNQKRPQHQHQQYQAHHLQQHQPPQQQGQQQQIHQRQDLMGMLSNGGDVGLGGMDNLNEILRLQQQLNLSSQNQLPNNTGNDSNAGLRCLNQRQNSFMSNVSNLSEGAPIPYNPQQVHQGHQLYPQRSIGFHPSLRSSLTMPINATDRRQSHVDHAKPFHGSDPKSEAEKNEDRLGPLHDRGASGDASFSTGLSDDKSTHSMGMSAGSASITSDIFSTSNSNSTATPPPAFSSPQNTGGRVVDIAGSSSLIVAEPVYENQQQSNRVDRRRVFSKMKVSTDTGTSSSSIYSGRSNGTNEWIPDINMVDSQHSLLSNFSNGKFQGSGGGCVAGMTTSCGAGITGWQNNPNSQSMVFGAFSGTHGIAADTNLANTAGGRAERRRSIMSGISRADDTSDMQSIFSDLSKKIGDASNMSVAMSEFSGIEDSNRMTANDAFSLAS